MKNEKEGMVELNEWQKWVIEEAWTKDGVEIQVSWCDGQVQSMSSNNEAENFEFPDIEVSDDLVRLGWTFDRQIARRVAELMPNVTQFSVADEIIKLAPEQLGDKRRLIIGLIKQHVHCEKHSVYSRFKHYVEHSDIQNILDLKVQTHRDYARRKPEENHV